RPAVIFRELGIPIYVVWDGNGGRTDDQTKRNRAFQRLMEIAEADIIDAPRFVKADCACFAKKRAAVMSSEIGKELFDSGLTEEKSTFGLEKREDGLKVPACVSAVLRKCAADGKKSTSLSAIVKATKALV